MSEDLGEADGWSMGTTWGVGLCVIAIWLTIGFQPWIWSSSGTNAGVFGDSFGFVNSLLSSLAFVIAMRSLAIQSKQSAKANLIALQTATLQETIRREQQKERAEAILGKTVSDAAQVKHKVGLLISNHKLHQDPDFKKLPEENQRFLTQRGITLIDEVQASVSTLLANNSIIAFAFHGHADDLVTAVYRFRDIPDRWFGDKNYQAESVPSVEEASEYLKGLSDDVGHEAIKVWSGYNVSVKGRS